MLGNMAILGEGSLKLPRYFPWRRLAVTLLVPVALMFAWQLGIGSRSENGIHAVEYRYTCRLYGIWPFGEASGIVELVAHIVPRWRPLRYSGPEGRAKLWRATLIVTPFLCLLHALPIIIPAALFTTSAPYAVLPLPVPVL